MQSGMYIMGRTVSSLESERLHGRQKSDSGCQDRLRNLWVKLDDLADQLHALTKEKPDGD